MIRTQFPENTNHCEICSDIFDFPKNTREEIFDFHRKSNFFRNPISIGNPISTASERPSGAQVRLTLQKFHDRKFGSQ